MSTANLVVTVIGADRPGLVEALSACATTHGANWEASRLVRLAGRFAGVVLVQVDEDRAEALERELGELAGRGLKVHVDRGPGGPEAPRAGRPLRVEVVGNDRQGIVTRVASALVALKVNVEELESAVEVAPMAGEQLFRLKATLLVPAEVGDELIRASLEGIGGDLMVDLLSVAG
ncbi:MAG: glycine cleavage system protein R [Planctomycetes bacterium]|nr:glycine cleavage system protein R [Planctomycetota bacterium]